MPTVCKMRRFCQIYEVYTYTLIYFYWTALWNRVNDSEPCQQGLRQRGNGVVRAQGTKNTRWGGARKSLLNASAIVWIYWFEKGTGIWNFMSKTWEKRFKIVKLFLLWTFGPLSPPPLLPFKGFFRSLLSALYYNQGKLFSSKKNYKNVIFFFLKIIF